MAEVYKEILRIVIENEDIRLNDIELEEDTTYIEVDDFDIGGTDFGF